MDLKSHRSLHRHRGEKKMDKHFNSGRKLILGEKKKKKPFTDLPNVASSALGLLRRVFPSVLLGC